MKKPLVYFAICSAIIGIGSIVGASLLIVSPTKLGFDPATNQSEIVGLIELLKMLPGIFLSVATISLILANYLGQRDDAHATASRAAKQSFDNSLFTMIGVLQTLRADVGKEGGSVDGLPIKTSPGEVLNAFRSTFRDLYDRSQSRSETSDIEQRLAERSADIVKLDITNLRAELTEAFTAALHIYDRSVEPYLRYLTSIFRYVERGPVEDKEPYITLIQEQLGGGEMTLLFYAGLAGYRAKGTTRYDLAAIIEKYGLVDGMREEHLLDPTHAYLYPGVRYQALVTKNAQRKYRDDMTARGVLQWIKSAVTESSSGPGTLSSV